MTETVFGSRVPVVSTMNRRASFAVTSFITSLETPAPAKTTRLTIPRVSSLARELFGERSQLVETVGRRITLRGRELLEIRGSCTFQCPRGLCRRGVRRLSGIARRLVENSEELRSLGLRRTRALRGELIQDRPKRLGSRTGRGGSQLRGLLGEAVTGVLTTGRGSFTEIVSALRTLDPLGVVSENCDLTCARGRALVGAISRIGTSSVVGLGISSKDVRYGMASVRR